MSKVSSTVGHLVRTVDPRLGCTSYYYVVSSQEGFSDMPYAKSHESLQLTGQSLLSRWAAASLFRRYARFREVWLLVVPVDLHRRLP